ncbi:hypothetical protein CLV63_114135 [Murinocardiopsis flavida]|uniref:Uncharacterized protein n=1 Tax=Murinocardiopsis flavida TaxID=645275 RepID=A0A2P8DER3_9ACTN|nr:hypothetical protein [Murinocardiopsis flavida]PSK95702.1 hypothetical protein CLV63_114135 [Murinocardiopsis flavida]
MFHDGTPRIPPLNNYGKGGPGYRRKPRGSESGAGVIEYASAIVLAAALLACVTVIAVPQTSDAVDGALCRLLQLAGVKDCGKKEPPDFRPDYCVRNAESKHLGGTVEIAVVILGQDYKLSKETLSDGSIVATFSPKSELGLITGLGGGVQAGKKSAGQIQAKVEAIAKGTYTPGKSYLFKNEQEYQQFEDQLNRTLLDDTAKDLSPGYRAARWLGEKTGVYEPPKMKDPEITNYELGVSEQIDGSIGAWLGKSTSQGRHAKDRGVEHDKWKMNLGADGSVKVNPKADLAFWNNEKGNKRTATTFSWSGTGSLGGALGPKSVGGEVGWQGSTRVMRNEDGSIDYIRYTTNASKTGADGTGGEIGKGGTKDNPSNRGRGGARDVNGESVTQSVQIDFDTPEEKEAGEALLRNRGLLPPTSTIPSLVNPLMDDKDGGWINEKPAEDAPPWEHVMHEKGKVWQYKEDTHADEYGVGAKAKLGLSLGADVSWGADERYTRNAQILGPPNEDGTRSFIDYPDCVYKGD